MIRLEIIEGKPQSNHKLTYIARLSVAFRNFHRLRQVPKRLKFREYRKLNSVSLRELHRDREVCIRETPADTVRARWRALQTEFSKNNLNDC